MGTFKNKRACRHQKKNTHINKNIPGKQLDYPNIYHKIFSIIPTSIKKDRIITFFLFDKNENDQHLRVHKNQPTTK